MKYFLHDTNAFADEKVTKVFMKYGYEGVGLFFCVLEKLAFQEKPIETVVLKKQMFMNRKLFLMLKFMVEIGLLEEQDGAIFSGSVMNVAEKYITKKEKTRKKVAEWRSKREGEENVTGYKVVTEVVTDGLRNHPKENKTKEKESKENDDEVKTTSAVEKIDAERSITSNNFSLKDGVSITELKTKVFKDVRFCLEFDGMGVPVEHLEGWLGAFNAWLEYTGETVKQEKDYRAHFKSWLMKQPYKTANPGTYSPVEGKVSTTRHDDAEELLKQRYG